MATGLDLEGVQRKQDIVKRALQVHQESIRSKDILRILAAIGGAEIVAPAVIPVLDVADLLARHDELQNHQ